MENNDKKGLSIGSHKALVAIPIILLIIAAAVLVNNVTQTGDWFTRSIELKGGTLISIKTTGPVNMDDVEAALAQFGQTAIRDHIYNILWLVFFVSLLAGYEYEKRYSRVACRIFSVRC